MIMAGLFMGLRISEIVSLRAEHLDLDGGQALVYQGKGSKDRYVPLRDDLVAELRAWLGDRRDGIVFASPRGGELLPRTFYGAIRKLAAAARIMKRVSPHTCRHSFASRLVQRGTDIVTVRDLLGHSSIAVTQVYLHADATKLKAAVERL